MVASPLIVAIHLPWLAPKAHVPVAGPRHNHLRDAEKMVDAVIRVDGAAPARGNHRRTHLALEHVLIGAGDHARPVDERFHVGGQVCKICGRAQQNAIGLGHFFDNAVHFVFDGATLVLVLKALIAGHAALNALGAKLNQLRLDAFFSQLGQGVIEHDGGIAVETRAAVDRENLHDSAPVVSGRGGTSSRAVQTRPCGAS